MYAPAELSAATRWRIAFARVGTAALAVAPLLVIGQMTRLALLEHSLAFDAANSYLPAARELLHGSSPYDLREVTSGMAFASPPIAALLFAPFTALPNTAVDAAMAVLMLASVLGALLAVGVRDWRCYAIAAISAPLVGEFQTANLSAVLALFVALLWRFRDYSFLGGAAAGLPVALKLFGWPMIFFLLVTRRFRAAAWSAAFAVAGILIPWAVVGYAGLREYPHLLRSLELAERGQVYSIGSLVASFVPWTAADVITCAIGAVLLVIAWGSNDGARAFLACVAAMLVFSPIVWMHYLVLLFVAIAIVSSSLTPLWAVPLLFWISGSEGPTHIWQNAFVLAVEAAVLVLAYRAAKSPAQTDARASATTA